MDPLVVTGRVGELVHSFLGDLDPVAVTEVLADQPGKFVESVDDSCSHVVFLGSGEGKKGRGQESPRRWRL